MERKVEADSQNENLESCNSTSETKDGFSEPITIVVYPPKNKVFHYDSVSESFQVQPVEVPDNIIQNIKKSPQITLCQNSLEQKDTGLTPLVETCMIFQDEQIQDTNASIESSKDMFDCNYSVKQILKVDKVFNESKLKEKCFLKGCKWSPDGLCLLTSSNDNILSLFEVTEHLITNPRNDVSPVLQMKEGGIIYDYEWYPQMNSSDPLSCVFASASQESPIHLWDAYTGNLRATYQPINQFDEVTPAYSVAFSPEGSKLYSGYKKIIRIFNICYPGRVFEERQLKIKGNPVFQTNIASTISISTAMPGLYAVGCYDKTIGLYGEPEGDLLFVLHGHTGGVTQIRFSQDGHYLFSGGRMDPEILCWDIRNPGKLVYSILRKVDTQQKIQFDLSSDGTYLITGTTDGNIKLYNVRNPPTKENILEPVAIWKGHEDCVNGLNLHPSNSLLASASGQRHFSFVSGDESEDDSNEEYPTIENSLKIWSLDLSQQTREKLRV
ncbi:hypothetical protein RUM44_004013 [Polyplax serrata]|uniref:WD repeat-containing protein 79 n=1 Tax=Polyplax serrata TaxID=468196 RepID=A0ABR1B1M0_POLSC